MADSISDIIFEITSDSSFGIMLTLLTYSFGVWLNRKAKTPLVNPMMISVVLNICVLLKKRKICSYVYCRYFRIP